MCNVQSVRQGVHRPVSIDTLDGLDAFRLTHMDVLDGKLDGDWTQEWTERIGQESCSEYPHFGQKFLVSLGHCVDDFGRRIDHRITYSIVARKRLIGNAINATATCMLPLRWSVSLHSADSW